MEPTLPPLAYPSPSSPLFIYLATSGHTFELSNHSLTSITSAALSTITPEQCHLLQSLPSLSSLEISQEISLETLTSLSQIPTLTSLSLRFQPASILPTHFSLLKNFKSLSVRCGYKQISLELVQTLISNNSELQSLSLIGTITSIEAIQNIITELKKLKSLRSLTIDEVECIFTLMDGFQHLPYLRKVNINTRVYDIQMEQLSDYIQCLEELDIGDCQANMAGFQCLSKHAATLKSFKFYKNILGFPDSKSEKRLNSREEILYIVTTFTELTELIVLGNMMYPELFEIIPNHLPKLQRFSFGEDHDTTPAQVMNTISRLPLLKYIWINYYFNNKTAQVILQSLPQFESVLLYSSYDWVTKGYNFRDSGAFYLAKIKGMKVVNLNENHVGDVGVMKVLRNLRRCDGTLQFNRGMTEKGIRNGEVMRLARHGVQMRERRKWEEEE